MCPITINTWDQLTNEGKALFKELELDKNPAVTLIVCEVHVPSDESGDDKVVFIDNPESLIALLEEAENTGKENLIVTIDVQSDDPTCDDSDDSSWADSDDSTGCSRNVSLLHCMPPCLPRNWSLKSLTLTINHFSPRSTEFSFTLIRFLESCISLKSLNLTLNKYSDNWGNTFAFRLRQGLGRNTSLISLTLTINIYSRGLSSTSHYQFDDYFVPNISINYFTLTINDFGMLSHWELSLGVLWSNYESLNTFNLTINNWDKVSGDNLLESLDAVMKVNSLRTLRVKINDFRFRNGDYPEYDFSEFVVKSPSLELIEVTICRYGVVGSFWQETLKWEKQ